MIPPITLGHLAGWEREVALLPRLEASLGLPLVKNTYRFSRHDYTSADPEMPLDVELKTRPARDRRGNLQTPERYDTWLVPACKVRDAERPVILFYYYEADDSLWRLDYDPELFATFAIERPVWHPSRQEHLLIPREVWGRVSLD